MSRSQAAFGSFRFDELNGLLRHGEDRVQLGSRARALLGALIEKRGELVTKAQLCQRAWPGVEVDERNLRVQIAGLRKALGHEGVLIRTEASLGYRFTGRLREVSTHAASAKRNSYSAAKLSVAPLGRDAEIDGILRSVASNRLVTILGAGGIGKTTVAAAVAEKASAKFTDGYSFVDLARATTEVQLHAAVIGTLDLPVEMGAAAEQVLLALQSKHVLLVLDNCEHIADLVASLVERIVGELGSVNVLTTSRESLRVAGELVWRLDPLEVPPAGVLMTAESAARFVSVQLFMRIVSYQTPAFQLDDGNAVTVIAICRKLDGIPLAIELAASMVSVLGIDEVFRGLDRRFSLLTVGRRNAVPRQRSMAATIDWSYSLLSRDEQVVLSRLAVFAGPFLLDAAVEIGSRTGVTTDRVHGIIVELVNKSLLNVSRQVAPIEYRLLETTRAYVLLTAEAEQERQSSQERHADYFLRCLETLDWNASDPSSLRARLRSISDDVHAALDWAFAMRPELGVRLTLAAERMWLALGSLVQGEKYRYMAFKRTEIDPGADARVRANVLVAVACSGFEIVTSGRQHDGALYVEAWQAARATEDEFLQVRALFGLIHDLLRKRRPISVHLAELTAVASRSSNPVVRWLPTLLSAYDDFEHSSIAASRRKLDAFITKWPDFPGDFALYFGHGMTTLSDVMLARAKYHMGQFEAAFEHFDRLLVQAEERADTIASFYILTRGLIWCELEAGQIERARIHLRKLAELSALYQPWTGFLTVFRSLLVREEFKVGSATIDDLLAAEHAFSRAIDHDPLIQQRITIIPHILLDLTTIRLMCGDLSGAEAALKRAYGYRMNDEDVRIVGRYEHMMARLATAKGGDGSVEAARQRYETAICLFGSKDFRFWQLQATVELAELELRTGGASQARSLIESCGAWTGEQLTLPGASRARHIAKQASELIMAELLDRQSTAS